MLLALGYAVWSYSLTDPNLVITGWSPYWQTQIWLWEHIWKQPFVLTALFTGLMLALFGWYAWLLRHLKSQVSPLTSPWILSWLVIAVIFIGSQNALSHDIFNYIFNAKMVLQYHTNPHIQTALDFPNDPWTRFMHNTHTPAPYGYGWTALSLLPASLGLNRFMLTWLAFKIFNLVAALLLGKILSQLIFQLKKRPATTYELALVLANPLFLIEMLGNGHNDLWMMVPALFSFSLLLQFIATKKLLPLGLAIGLFVLSLSTKFATAAILPTWGLLLCMAWVPQKIQFREHLRNWFSTNWPFINSLLLFAPLFTDRSQQFHPWYLVWILVWLPLTPYKWWHAIIWSFSLSSLLRYVPWLINGGYNDTIITQQKMITWLFPVVCFIILQWYGKKHSQHS